MLHEPPLLRALANANAVLDHITSVIEQGRLAGGSRGAVEAIVRFAAGDANFESLAPPLKERVLGNAATLFEMEFGVIEDYLPDAATLSAVKRRFRSWRVPRALRSFARPRSGWPIV